MIPKRIFYVWGVNDDKKRDVLACMQSWRQICPDYEIIEINEASTKYFNFQEELKANRWFKTVYERKMWAYVADYIRIKTLYENGGIYLDTDVTVLKPFDKFLNDPAFVGMQNNIKETDSNYVEPAILGAQKNNEFLEEILNFYEEGIWNEPIFTMPQIFEKFLQDKYKLFEFPCKKQQKIIDLKDINIYPERYFIPFRYREKFTPECIEEDTHTIHWFGGSWTNPEVIYWLMHKHLPESEQMKHPEIETKITYVKLFKVIPFLKITDKKGKLRVYLFSLIPLFKYRKNKIYLFSLFPILSIREKRKIF